MSCSFKPFGNIANISSVKNYLLGEPDKLDFTDDSWNWGADDDDDKSSLPCWLDNSFFSLSPTADILAVANQKSLLIFTAKWDTQEEGESKVKYLLKWQGDPRRDATECVSSVLCLPIAANGRLSSSHFAPDWTAIAVGFDSGAVRFYTEGGALLLNEKFHLGPVKSLKCQTFLHSGLELQDELYIFYRSIICLIPGLALTTSLTATRNQLTKVLAKASEDAWEGPRLACTKWELTDQAKICDAQVLGKRCPSMYEHLVSASLEGGYLAHYSPSPLARYDVMAVGCRPYVALHSIREGSSAAPVLADVAKHVASKLIQMTSIGQAIPGWLGGGRRDSRVDIKEKASLEPAEPMTCRFGLADIDRKGEKMVCCPYGKLAAVSDSFGRVTLMDTYRGMALRMWKGYRQAQCAFIPVLEDKGQKRKSMFLAIYAPKKGIIQVWALQSGPMVATFPVSKNGRLHYSSYGLLNLPVISFKGTNLSQFPCVFLDGNGTLSVISVPFHIVLSVMNDEKARDNHLIRQIRKVLESEGDVEQAIDLFHQIKSAESVKQVLEFIVKYKLITPHILTTFLTAISSRFAPKESTEMSENVKALSALEEQIVRSCSNIAKLLVLYEFFIDSKDQPPDYTACVSPSPSTSFDNDRLKTLLRVDDKELESLVTSLSQFEDLVSKPRVRFEQGGRTNLHTMLSCFLSTYSSELPLRTDPNATSQALFLGELLSQGIIFGNCSISKWKALVEEYINIQDLLHLVLCYWLSKPHCQNIYNEVSNFADLIHAICSMTDSKEINFWWPDIRNLIKASCNIPSALSAVYVMRAVTIGIEERLFDKGDGDWVAISEQSCIWTQMVDQLEAILVLQSAVRYRNKGNDCSLVAPIEVNFPQISLATFLTNGPGLVGELVAQWVGSWGLSVEWIRDIAASRAQTRVASETPTSPQEPLKAFVVDGSPEAADASFNALPITPLEERALSILECLMEKFPFSLSADSLACNLAWEYSLAWTRDRNKLVFLNQVISAIKAISHPNIQHGICCLIWSTHISSTYESTVKLLHKVGKVPKARQCVQDLGVEEAQVKELLSFYVTYLQLFIESSLNVENNDGGEIETERLWNEGDSPLSLVKVCTTKTCFNRDLLLLKKQCAHILYLMMVFNLRFHQPLTSLFGTNGDILLMNDILNQTKVKSINSTEDLDKSRISFLKKIITSIVEQMPENPEMSECKEIIGWFSDVYKLSTDWWLNTDHLRIHQVFTLYLHNHDKWAQELVSSVGSKHELGLQLLTVAGRRLKTVISEPGSSIKETLVKLGPSLTLWLQQLEGCKFSGNINSLKELSMIIVTLVKETSPDYVTADLLYEALSSL